jgi:signal transduction histidine kinase
MAATSRPDATGLSSMETRARILGGRLHVGAGAEGGTVVALDVPLDHRTAVQRERGATVAAP